jgi:hypothetical protein
VSDFSAQPHGVGVTLLAWSQELADWQRDALHRIALCEALSDSDRAAICARLRRAHGIAVEDETDCLLLAEADLPAAADAAEPVILCGLGPLRYVDKLADDQELRCGVNGITLNFGDNGTGKTGYSRVAKKLCLARIVDDLQGDVFAAQVCPPAQARFRYRRPGAEEPEAEDWTDGDPRPAALSRTMVLDAANARVYVDGRSEISYLPREIEIVARLGTLCTELADEVQREAEPIAQRYRNPCDAAFNRTTPAGRLVSRLVVATALEFLPSEAALREAGAWDDDKETELAALEAALAQNPATRSAALRRSERILGALADDLDAAATLLDDPGVAVLSAKLAQAIETARVAALSAADQFKGEPIPQAGQGAWERMYAYARQFAAESGVRGAAENFQPGDPCPYCQTGIDAATAERLGRFDAFVRSAAATDATTAATALESAKEDVNGCRISDVAAIEQSLAAYRHHGVPEARLAQVTLDYASALIVRKTTVIEGIERQALGECGPLPLSPAEALRAEAARLAGEAEALDALPADDGERVARAGELRDAHRLSLELDTLLTRRAELEHRLRLLRCKDALDTRNISTFATRRRRELVTPDLRERIRDEIAALDLGHIPLRLEEASERGRNFFDMALDAPRHAAKTRVLSEGEQRALGIACFFAEMARLPGRHGIIVDDPVSSLDHQRLRKVASRLVEEAAAGRQVIIFTHHLIFYQEILAAAAARTPQVPVIVNLIGKADGRYGVISENDEPWIAKKVVRRVEALRARLAAIPADVDRTTDDYRRMAKDFYTDVRETWERLVEEILLNGVVQRFCSGVKTQSLKEVLVDDSDYQVIYAAMTRVSEFSGHDMAAGRQIPVADLGDMRRDLDQLDDYRVQVHARKRALQERRAALEDPPVAVVV